MQLHLGLFEAEQQNPAAGLRRDLFAGVAGLGPGVMSCSGRSRSCEVTDEGGVALPIAGRAARTMSSDGWKPLSVSSRLLNPVGIPLIEPSLSIRSKIRAKVSSRMSLIAILLTLDSSSTIPNTRCSARGKNLPSISSLPRYASRIESVQASISVRCKELVCGTDLQRSTPHGPAMRNGLQDLEDVMWDAADRVDVPPLVRALSRRVTAPIPR